MKARFATFCCLLMALAFMPCRADQTFAFTPPTDAGSGDVNAVMHDLAERILPVYEEPDPLRYMANLSALQMTVGDYKAAYETQQNLQDRLRSDKKPVQAPSDHAMLLDFYAQAMSDKANGGTSFKDAFSKLFRDAIPKFDDHDAYALTTWNGAPASSTLNALQRAFDRLRGKPAITTTEALGLIHTYLAFEVYQQVQPLVDRLGNEDDQRRYVIEDDVQIKSPGGAVLHARVVRPRGTLKPLPTLFKFTIVKSRNDAIASAAHGYAGVVAYTRRAENGRAIPFEHDGADARAVIRWIVKQPWSDGRVGMYGDRYAGFAAWAAAKYLPRALKAIATADAMAPGFDFPMQGHIYQNAAYRWLINNTREASQTGTGYDAFWNALDQSWYTSGKAYHDLDQLAKMPSHRFQRWLSHPSFDWYWQDMMPVHQQFAGIDIPVLTIAGYYADGETGSLYYYTRHHHYRKNADDTLVIGPYDDAGLTQSPAATLRGYRIDSAALINLQELQYQWFDHIFKGSPKPALLQDRVNYEVMDANAWQHAPSLDAMRRGPSKFYLDAGADDQHVLTPTKPAPTTSVDLSVDFADRKDASVPLQTEIISDRLGARHSVIYQSAPLKSAGEISGQFSGQLDFKVNKRDMDLDITLYELRRDGGYFQLAAPYQLRASYAGQDVYRKLLAVNRQQTLPFSSDQIISRKLAAGSRIVLVLGINKRPDEEINYGAGNDVAAESITDAKTPLKIQWYGDSYVNLPVSAAVFANEQPNKVTQAPSPPASGSSSTGVVHEKPVGATTAEPKSAAPIAASKK